MVKATGRGYIRPALGRSTYRSRLSTEMIMKVRLYGIEGMASMSALMEYDYHHHDNRIVT